VEAAPFERFLEHGADVGQAAVAAAQHDKFSFARFLAFIQGEVRREVAQRPVTEDVAAQSTEIARLSRLIGE
jgi:hypothetical protein